MAKTEVVRIEIWRIRNGRSSFFTVWKELSDYYDLLFWIKCKMHLLTFTPYFILFPNENLLSATCKYYGMAIQEKIICLI